MFDRWFYTRKGQSHGPVSAEQIKVLATKGLLSRDDLVWREGAHRQTAVRAETVVDFKAATPKPAPVPNWLSDVAQVEATRVRRPIAKPAPAPTPLWLDDVRRLEDLLTGRTRVAIPPPSSLPMDWLDDIRQIEESLGGQAKPKAPVRPPLPASPPATPVARAKPPSPPAPAKPAGTPTPPTPLLSPLPPPIKPTLPPKAVTPTPAAPSGPPVPPPLRPTPPPKASALPPNVPSPAPPRPQPPPVPEVPPAPAAQKPAPPSTVSAPAPPPSKETMGFDPDTGQILDAARYAKWQKEEQRRRQEEAQAQPAVSVYEAFLIARTAFQEWVDAEANKSLILAGNLQAIRELPQIDGLLRSCAGYGPVMQEKLGKHLGFLLENRRKFYIAFSLA